MNNAILPDDSEISYRKVHYKYAKNVMDGIIFCAICNVDLKQGIILKEKIMVHKLFLCLCCKNCFEKLSDSPNGCILCSAETKLMTCENCHHHMCQRCIYNYYMKSSRLKRLRSCLKCSCNVLWSLRSQAIAVLKCCSSELDSRLLLNGEESENQQYLYEFLKNSSKCDEICTLEVINEMRMNYFYDKIINEIQPLRDEIIKLQVDKNSQFSEIIYRLNKQILEGCCSILFDIKCLFNNKMIEWFYTKVQSILNDPLLIKYKGNDSHERLNYYKEKIDIFKLIFSNGGFDQICFSVKKMKEEGLKPYILEMRNNRTVEDSESINHGTKNSTHFSMETLCQQHNDFNLTSVSSNRLKPANVKQDILLKSREIKIKTDKEIKDHHVTEKFKENARGEKVNKIITHNTKFNINDEKLSIHPLICSQKLDGEFSDMTIGNQCVNKSANVIANQNIECNKTIKLVNNNEGPEHIGNPNKFDEKYNTTIAKKPSTNKKNKTNCKENTTFIATKTNNKRKKSTKYDFQQIYYPHKKFRREERLKIRKKNEKKIAFHSKNNSI